jgi:hypothetical protein
MTHEIIVSGTLPKGETTQNLTYFIVEHDTKAIVSQVFLPNASNRIDNVHMLLKVARVCTSYEIGTFEANDEFKPVQFLSVRGDLNPSPAGGPGERPT